MYNVYKAQIANKKKSLYWLCNPEGDQENGHLQYKFSGIEGPPESIVNNGYEQYLQVRFSALHLKSQTFGMPISCFSGMKWTRRERDKQMIGSSLCK